MPEDVLHFARPGARPCGAQLVRDPRVALIAFTGSQGGGAGHHPGRGHTPEEQPHVKKVVCEMGGKNAIIVDNSADLDEAVLGAAHAAFNFQGQKCSACSRVIVVDEVHDRFLQRLVEGDPIAVRSATRSSRDGCRPGDRPGRSDKIHRYIEQGKQEGKLELEMDARRARTGNRGKPFVGPHIFSGRQGRPRHRPRGDLRPRPLRLPRRRTFDEALRIANASPLQAHGRRLHPQAAHLEQAKGEFRVGNLYLNRGITGAMVGRQPFGGFGMSGVGSKAGGKDYLLQFVEPRASCENTMRRGFCAGVVIYSPQAVPLGDQSMSKQNHDRERSRQADQQKQI